jgi:cytosine/adenosine deaminase-related metal-dependent hydrolase
LPAANDLHEDDYFAVMDDIWRETRDHPRIDLWFGPPGPQWVSDVFMQRIAERAETYDVGIQTHVTESIYEKLHGPRFYGKDTLAHLRELGVLSPRFTIAHGVWLTEAEIEILAETGAAVSHNPSSNLRLRAGIAPLNALIEAGATLALGMDGTTINDDEDMFAEMRLALRLHRTPMLDGPAPSVAQIFEMATAGGAKLLRKETSLGRLAPGYAADLVLVDLERITWPWVAPEVDPRDLLVQRARAGDVDTVLIAGEVVLRDGQPTRFDAAEAGRELAARLAAEPYPEAAARLVEALLPRVEAYYRGWEMPELEPYSVYNSRR